MKIYRRDSNSPGEQWEDDTPVYHHTSYALLMSWLPEGKILDAGCGVGRWVRHLEQRGYDVGGIDHSLAAIKRAKSKRVHLGDVRNIQGRYSAIISLGVVEHFEEGPQEALGAFYKALEPRGRLLISVPTNTPLRRVISNNLKRLYWLGKRMRFEENRYTRKEFRRFLTHAGFVILDEIPDDFDPPLNIGLWIDYPFLRAGNWKLNWVGNILRNILWSISPWLCPCGAFWVCEKENNGLYYDSVC